MSYMFTIAIPTFNNELTIRRSVESCLNQTDLAECEILVVNNASTDSTRKILAEYDGRVRVIENEKTVSLFENHNVAFKNSKGKYIVFCHSDDILYPDAVASLKRKIKSMGFPAKYIVWGHSQFRDFFPVIRNSNFTTGQVFAGIYATNPFLNCGLTPSGTCYSKEFYAIGGFLGTDHRQGPSDATSMINAALCGFKFEMMQDILFERTTASTLGRNTKVSVDVAGYRDAFEIMLSQIDDSRLLDIIDSVENMNTLPYRFLQLCSRRFPRIVFLKMIRYGVRNPKNLLKVAYYKVLSTGLINWFK